MRALLALAALMLLPALPAAAAGAGEVVRLPAADAALDRNGDGFQDVIVAGRSAHFDVDGDGRFDYTLTLAFKEYSAEGHLRYLASGLAPGVFEELTRAGLNNLCASERVAANWTAEHFDTFLYYRDGYGRLQLLDSSPGNDGRLAGDASRPSCEATVTFNPDGTVATVQRGERTVTLATFDYGKNVSSGTRLLLPKIAGPADLAAIRAEIGRLFEAPP